MSEPQEKKPAPSFADAAIRAKDAKAAKKAKVKKEQAAAGSKHAPKTVKPQVPVSSKAHTPRMRSRAKRG